MCRIYDVKNSCLGCLGSSQNKLTFLFFVDGWVDLPFLFIIFIKSSHFCHNFFYCDSFVHAIIIAVFYVVN